MELNKALQQGITALKEGKFQVQEQEIFMKKRNAKLQALKYSAIRHSKKLEKFLSF